MRQFLWSSLRTILQTNLQSISGMICLAVVSWSLVCHKTVIFFMHRSGSCLFSIQQIHYSLCCKWTEQKWVNSSSVHCKDYIIWYQFIESLLGIKYSVIARDKWPHVRTRDIIDIFLTCHFFVRHTVTSVSLWDISDQQVFMN